MVTGTCKLFEINAELKESHIYPKFAIEYMKKTGSRFLRNITLPNKREQDGVKRYWLSDDAEQRFGIREKWFKENIFLPYMEERQSQFDYNENLFYFGISFLWRALLISYEDSKIINQPFYESLKEVEKEWREFLVTYRHPNKFDNLHLFLTNRVTNHNIDAIGVDMWVTRATDATIIWTNDYSYIAVYGKFLRFIFWVVIKGGNEKETEKTKINNGKGKIESLKMFDDSHIKDFIEYRVKERMTLPKASENQMKIIINEFKTNYENLINTDAVKSKLNDELNLDK